MSLQSIAQSVKIESAGFRCRDDLHRTTTAEDRGGSGRCVEVIESTEPAAGTGGVSRGPDIDASLTFVPEIPGDECGVDRCRGADQNLECLKNLMTRDDGDGRSQHARSVAGRRGPGCGRIGKQATKARRGSGKNDEGGAFGSNHATVHPGDAALNTGVVEEIATWKIVEAIDDEVHATQKLKRVLGIEMLDHGMDRHAGIDRSHTSCRGISLRPRALDVGHGEQRLPLKVGRFDDVAIDERQSADTGSSELIDGEGAEGSAPDDHDMRLLNRRLPGSSDFGQKDLTMMSWYLSHG